MEANVALSIFLIKGCGWIKVSKATVAWDFELLRSLIHLYLLHSTDLWFGFILFDQVALRTHAKIHGGSYLFWIAIDLVHPYSLQLKIRLSGSHVKFRSEFILQTMLLHDIVILAEHAKKFICLNFVSSISRSITAATVAGHHVAFAHHHWRSNYLAMFGEIVGQEYKRVSWLRPRWLENIHTSTLSWLLI